MNYVYGNKYLHFYIRIFFKPKKPTDEEVGDDSTVAHTQVHIAHLGIAEHQLDLGSALQASNWVWGKRCEKGM